MLIDFPIELIATYLNERLFNEVKYFQFLYNFVKLAAQLLLPVTHSLDHHLKSLIKSK